MVHNLAHRNNIHLVTVPRIYSDVYQLAVTEKAMKDIFDLLSSEHADLAFQKCLCHSWDYFLARSV
jgi:hypothetical protein